MKCWADVVTVAAVVGLAALALGGCGGSLDRVRGVDGHPRVVPVDLASIPDAVPRSEPPSRHGNPPEYEVFGQRYRTMASSAGFEERGLASWYGTKFHGRRTSSGEAYDMFAMTAAHRSLPLPSYVEVINLDNGKRVVVRVNDRGPFVGGRIVDLSYAAAHRIGMLESGVAPVLIRSVGPGSVPPEPLKVAQASPVVLSDAVDSVGAVESSSRYVQVGAFSDPGAAERVRRDLRALGFSDVRVTTLLRDPDPPLHRVRIGPLEHTSAVQDVTERLHRAALEDYRVVIDPPR